MEPIKQREKNPFDPPGRGQVIKVAFYILATVLIVLLVAILFSVVLSRKNGEPPSVFGYSVFIVASDSMEPTLSVGDALLVKKVDPSRLAVEDVITFREGYDGERRMLVNTHRIVEILEEDGQLVFRTQGDNRTEPDEVLRTRDDILGQAVSSMPAVGSFFAFVKTPLGLVVCIAVPLFILLIFEVVNLVRISRRNREEEEAEEENSPLETAVRRRRELFEGTRMQEEAVFSAEEEAESSSTLPAGGKGLEYAFKTPISPVEQPEPPQPEKSFPLNLPVVPQEESIPLEYSSSEPVRTVSYKKVPAVPAAPVQTTQEFQLKPFEPDPVPAGETFAADMAVKGEEHFKIDGIDVQVKSDAINLALEGGREEREISITVTKECTNVLVGDAAHEVNFALFRDEKEAGQKVVIQKKSREKR